MFQPKNGIYSRKGAKFAKKSVAYENIGHHLQGDRTRLSIFMILLGVLGVLSEKLFFLG